MKEELQNVLKRVLICLYIIIGILSVDTVINISKNIKFTKSETSQSTDDNDELSGDYDISKFDEIKATDISSESKDKTILVYIGRETCGYCVKFIPVLQEVQEKHSYTTKYIDIAKIIDYTSGNISDQDAYDTLIKMDTVEEQSSVMDEFGATPMTLIIKDNKIIDSVVGYVEADTLTSLIDKNGLE